MKKLMLAVLIPGAFAALAGDVAALEAGLKSDIMAVVDQVNPIDAATGQRKYISFAFITDFHKCKRVEGDDDATNPDKTYWYGSAGVLTESEQSIRLLGSLATDAGLDAVIAGGDFATAPIIGDGTKAGLTEAEYTNEIWNVKSMFNQHVPASVPLFAIDGNHERSYTANGANMQMSDEAWGYVLTNFNTSASVARAHNVDVTYHRDLANAKLGDNATGAYNGNSYHIDLRRLVASGGCNVRIACVSMYDSAMGANPAYRVYDAAQFYDAGGALIDSSLTPENTVIGMVAHGTEERLGGTMARAAAGTLMNGFMNGYANPANKTGPWNLGAHEGKAFLGLVAGHLHFTSTKEITDPYDEKVNGGNTVRASAVSVASAYGVNYPAKANQHELGTQAAYHFSIFVVDTDSSKLREVRLGGWSTNPVTKENPVVQLHDFNLRTKSGAAVDSGTDGGDSGTGEGDSGVVVPPATGEAILPGATAVETRQGIQAAIDAAVPVKGAVALGAGLFDIDEQLCVTGGVMLVGQGWENTVVRYVGNESPNGRVVLLKDGSTLGRIAVTGGRQKDNSNGGGGIYVENGGTVSWCCVTNNCAKNHIGGGIGVLGAAPVKIDHTIVADNSAGLTIACAGGGIGIRAGSSGAGLTVEIDTCLVYSNTVASGSCGAGIGITYKKYNDGSSDFSRVATIVRNTTIVDNRVAGTGRGGALYTTQKNTTLTSCIISDNTAPDDPGVAFVADEVFSEVTDRISHCLFGGGAAPLGANAVIGNPQFKDASACNYRLTRLSPAVNCGMRAGGTSIDLDARPRGRSPDIGCYELPSQGTTVTLR